MKVLIVTLIFLWGSAVHSADHFDYDYDYDYDGKKTIGRKITR